MQRNRSSKTERRISQSPAMQLYGRGGFGILPRRGVDGATTLATTSVEGVMRLASSSPLELLSCIPDIVPEVGLAVWNCRTLGTSPESFRIYGGSKDTGNKVTEVPEATAILDTLFLAQPDEVGDQFDMAGDQLEMLLFSGMDALEAVPGKAGTGLEAIYPCNTLTLRFDRDDRNKLILAQKQLGIAASTQKSKNGYVPMPMDRFFWGKMGGIPDDPYGRVPMAPVVNEALLSLSFMRDLSRAVHRIGYPFYDVGLDEEAIGQYARETMEMTNEDDIAEYVDKKYEEAMQAFNDRDVDDAYFHSIRAIVQANGAGDKFANFGEIWQIFRSRLIMALKHNPALMGIVEGSTETWSVVQWDIFVRSLRTLVAKALKPILKACNLHFQLLGMPYFADVEYAPLPSIDALDKAAAREKEIGNEVRLRDEGLQSQEETAMTLTGNAPVADGPVREQQQQQDKQPADKEQK